MKRTSLSAHQSKLSRPLRDKRSGAISLQDPRLKSLKAFGGSLLKNSHAKVARNLSTKHAMHLVLKSSLAKGENSLRSLRHQKWIFRFVREVADKYNIRIYEYANAGSHLQLLIQLPNRQAFAPFIRTLTGAIAQKVMGTTKVRSLKKILTGHEIHSNVEKFWDYRPWTRIVVRAKTYSLAAESFIHRYLAQINMITWVRGYERYFREAPA